MSHQTVNNNQTRIRGVFFDLYGTLLTYGDMSKAWSDWLNSFYTQLNRCGLAMSREEFASCCDCFFSKKAPKIEDNDLTVFEHRIKSLCNDLNLTVKNNEIKTIASTSAAIWQKQIALAPNAGTVLKELKKTKTLGLITNFDHPPHIHGILRHEGLEPLFDVMIISGEVEMKKPDPRIFHLALEKTGLAPAEVVYVGDTAVDVEGATAASMVPILIQRKVPVKNGYAHDFNSGAIRNAAGGSNDSEKPLGVRTIGSLLELTGIVR